MQKNGNEIIIEHIKQLIMILGALSLGSTAISANLRHAYKQLNDETVKDQKEFANGLIAPAIARLEELVILLEQAKERYHAVIRDYPEGDTRH